MTSLNISLPDQLKAYIESRVASGDYGTPSEYVRELVRRDKQINVQRLEGTLLNALQSGDISLSEGELNDPSLLKVLRKKLNSRHKSV
ncbi:type II toxin-antitoxin system ParD family antitoxin [Silvibacterium acidisoli]|uniref:type II toxin-antitoxin system ParD family antitoxin n=1 Tax=Acidobacteriaceae bacterium ZG23-2 TaxID=2883246 RepID=UPI00406C2712